MKKRFIPATVAALALTFTTMIVPPVSATEGGATPDFCKDESETRDEPLFTGNAALVELNGVQQDSGFRVHGDVIEQQVFAFDSEDNEIAVHLGEPQDDGTRPILLTPPRSASGPIRLEVFDAYQCGFQTRFVGGSITVGIGGSEGVVKANATVQPSGLTVTNRERSPISFDAVDEDGQDIEVTFGKMNDRGAEPILLTPGTNVDGPITLSFTLPGQTQARSFSIGVEGHAPGVDDNDSGSGSDNETVTVTVTGTPGTLKATDESQSTGLTIANSTKDTQVLALDAENNRLTASITDGKIMVTPGTEATGPITLIVMDQGLEDSPRTFTLQLGTSGPGNGPTDNEPSSSSSEGVGSSEDSDVDWTSIAVAGVVAAVIGVIVAVGGQFLPTL